MTVNLVAFPYAGANAHCYRQLAQCLPDGIKLITHELPGRGVRNREPLRRRLHELVHDAIARLEAHLRPPYALYGHSLGAWLAHAVLRKLAETRRPLPLCLFVSARRAPLSPMNSTLLHRLPTPQLKSRLAEFGGTPGPVFDDPELMALFEPILRADLEVLETCTHERQPPLDVPIRVFLGREDNVTAEQAATWQLESNHQLAISYFPGGHFFIREHARELAAIMGATLEERAVAFGMPPG